MPSNQTEITVPDRRGNLIKPQRFFDEKAAVILVDI